MSEFESRFWQNQETNPSRPIETAIVKLEPAKAADFAKGTLEIYNAAVLVNPDVIFFPERGAGPFRWGLEFLEERSGESFYKVPLMIGTETEVISGESHGQIRPDKRTNVRRGVETTLSILRSVQKPMLIDEVQSGGTIRLAAQYLINSLREHGVNSPLYLIAVQGSSSDERKMASGYKTLISNTKPGIRAAVIETSLFAMDNQSYLNHELVDYPATKERGRPMPMLMHNIEAERMIKRLVLAYINPEALSDALTAINQNTIPNGRDASILYSWISEFLDSLDANSWIYREDAIQWFWDYYSQSINKDPSNLTVLLR